MSLFETGPKHLVEFRCGKMTRDGNMVKPDNRKGLLYCYEAEEMLHLCWKDRKTGKLEEDLILFPTDAEFEKVPQCTTGRVFVLKIHSAVVKHFFWMQEPKADKDDEYLTSINRLINNPAGGAFGGQDFGGDFPSGSQAMAQDELLQMFRSIASGQQPTTPAPATSSSVPTATLPSQTPAPTTASQLPAATAPASTTQPPATASTSAPAPAIGLSQLQSILSGIQVPEQKPDADLTKILTVEQLAPLFSDPQVQQRLFPFLPAKAERTQQELEDIIRSPQFVQALASLNAGLQSGQLGPLIAELGLDPAVGGPLGGVEAFLRAIQDKVNHGKQ